MANRFNWSAAFGGAGAALQQGVNVHAAKDIEDLKSQREENLSRFALEKQIEHEDWRAKYGEDMATKRASQAAATQAAIADRTSHDIGVREAGADTRAQAHEKAMLHLALGAQAAAEGRQTAALTAAEKAQRDRDIQGNRREMNNAAMTFDNQRRQLSAAIAAEAGKNLSISMISDPDKRREAMAKDPAIGDLMRQQAELEATRTQVLNNYTLQAHELGDPNFPGQKAPPSAPEGPPDPSIPSLDGPDTSSPAPRLTGMRPPVKSMVGPLMKPTTGIPSLMPGIGGGPPDNPLAGPQMPTVGAIPSLIPGT